MVLQTWLLNQRAFIVSQMRFMGTIGYQQSIADKFSVDTAKSIYMVLQRVAVSLEPTREICLSSSMVAFSGWAMSKGRAID